MHTWAAVAAVFAALSEGFLEGAETAGFPEGPRELQACESLGPQQLAAWCTGGALPPLCFHVESETVLPSSCHLRGPQGLNHGGTALLGAGTLVGSDLLLSGQLELLSLRLDLDGSLTLEDAEVLMSHNETGEVERGGAFAANGSVTLRRSSLAVEGTRAQDGGGFYAGNLTLLEGSNLSISGTSASDSGGGFWVDGLVTLDRSSIWLRRTRATVDVGGFFAELGLQLKHGASLQISDSAAGRDAGGFYTNGDPWLQDSVLSIRNVSAGRLWGAFYVAKMMLETSNLTVEGATAMGCGSFFAGETKLLESNLQILDSRAVERSDLTQEGADNSMAGFVGGFLIAGGLTLDASSIHLLRVHGKRVGGFQVDRLELKRSLVTVQHAHAVETYGAVCSNGTILLAEDSALRVSDSSAPQFAGGIFAGGSMHIIGKSTVHVAHVASSEGSGIFSGGDVALTDGSLLHISHAVASGGRLSGGRVSFGQGGGLVALGYLQILRNSTVGIEHAKARDFAGGFDAEGVRVADGSLLLLRNTSSDLGHAGGFYSKRAVMVSDSSKISIHGTASGDDGGGFYCGSLQVSGGSVIEISQATSQDQGGGFGTNGFVMITGGSRISISDAQAASYGGAFFAKGDLTIADGSELLIDSVAGGKDSGGFQVSGVEVSDQSLLSISGAVANGSGGAFCSTTFRVKDSNIIITDSVSGEMGGGFVSQGDVLLSNSSLHVARCSAASQGGGFNAQAALRVIQNSTVHLQDVTAARGGAGFGSLGRVEIHGSSLEISGAVSEDSGGGFDVSGPLVVNRSTLHISNATARQHGGGFIAEDVTLTASQVSLADVAAGPGGDGAGFNVQATLRIEDGTTVSIWNASARRWGGGFSTILGTYLRRAEVRIVKAAAGEVGGGFSVNNLEVVDSMLIASECVAQDEGGGFSAKNVSLSRTHLSISGGAFQRGGGIFATKLEALDSEVLIVGLDGTVEPSADIVLGSGAFVEGPLRLTNSAFQLQNLGGKSAIEARCLRLAQSTLSLDAYTQVGISLQNAACTCGPVTLHMQGALVGAGVSSALLSAEPCGNDTLEIAHVRLTTAQAALAEASTHTRLRNITVEYVQDVQETQLLAAPSYEAEAVEVSCVSCARGVTFAPGASSELQVVSPPRLMCEQRAFLNMSTTARCRCAFPEQVPDRNYGDDVQVSETGSYCMYCQAHFEARDENCSKCPLYKAWSEGTGDPCATLPPQAEWWLPLLLAAVVFVLLGAAAFEVVWAPLAVVDAHTVEGEGLLMTVQGPICYLPKLLQRHIHRNVAFRFFGTGLSWLDGSERDFGSIKALRRCKLQLPPTPEQPAYVCATSKGFLRVSSGYGPMLLQFWMLLFLLLLVPAILAVAGLSRNYPQHVLGTAGLFALPLMVCVGFLHPLVAWLLRRQRTPLQEACREYLSELSPPSSATFPGEDQDHPSNQGLSIQALQHFWEHFRRFILDRTMHFVVANIVEPLTEKLQTSLVGLLQGKAVSHFVSHSWATPFQHFVQCLQRHAAFTGAVNPTYWICSFANNQWDIASEIGTDVLDSAFAKVLQSGVQGVVMVLDQQVQPFTRVWCLFELFLSSKEALQVVFATDCGILGDALCDSVGIALELGRRISCLRVETCQASSELDKQRIFAYIRRELGSLERMDAKIKEMIRDMLRRNLQHARTSTASLRQQLEEQ